MNFEMLYSIAVDLIKKRRVQFIGVQEYVCVLITKNNSIFTGNSNSTIQDGRTVLLCAERKAIDIMLRANETTINALVLVDCQTLLPCIPCKDCRKLMLEASPENAGCYIMQQDRSFAKLSELSSKVEASIWEDGWNDFEGASTSQDVVSVQTTSTLQPIPQMDGNSTMFNPNANNDSFSFSPVPNRGDGFSASSQYSSSWGAYQHLNGISPDGVYQSVGGSTLQTAVVQKSNSTFVQRQSIETTDSNRFQERLRGIMGEDSLRIPKDSIPNASTTPIPTEDDKPKIFSTGEYTKKELRVLAKEKKRQAKKNSKILDSISKRT